MSQGEQETKMDGWMQRSTVDQTRAKMLSIIKGSNDGVGRVLDTTWRIDRELKSGETIARSRAVVKKKAVEQHVRVLM